jgi:hypothetical protein
MIDSLTQNDLRVLAGRQKSPCLSLYMPTLRIGSDALQNMIRLKNLLIEAVDRLGAQSQHRAAAKKLMQPPLGKVLEDQTLWNDVSSGMALFRSADTLRFWRLPVAFPMFVWVGDRFYLKPLLPLATHDDRFYLLAVSQKDVRLFEGSRYDLVELHLAGVPASLQEALHYHQPEGMFQVRSVSPSVHGKEGAIFHGQGAATEHPKDDLLAYFRLIDKALHGFLKHKQAPLLFAGVEYLFPIYCRANRYPNLLERPLAGNMTCMKPGELHRQAAEFLMSYWHRDQTQDLRRFQQAAGTDHVSSELKEILPAAFEGRIEALFVASDVEPWGHFDPASGRVELTSREEPGSDELLDLAASATLKRGGRVHAVKSAKLPEGRLASALLRHSVARLPAVSLAK